MLRHPRKPTLDRSTSREPIRRSNTYDIVDMDQQADSGLREQQEQESLETGDIFLQAIDSVACRDTKP